LEKVPRTGEGRKSELFFREAKKNGNDGGVVAGKSMRGGKGLDETTQKAGLWCGDDFKNDVTGGGKRRTSRARTEQKGERPESTVEGGESQDRRDRGRAKPDSKVEGKRKLHPLSLHIKSESGSIR